jgi:hypothetical protein
MKPGLLDICAIIWSLAMVVILALEIDALRSRGPVQWAGGDAGVKSAEHRGRQFASTEATYAAVYHRMGDCHPTPNALCARWQVGISSDFPATAVWLFNDRRSGP